MQGFDPKFTTPEDYILGVTHEIWEDRGIATLHRYYAPDIVVRSPASVVTGNQGVIAATMATLAEFPDRTLLGEDVIWSGTPERRRMASSPRTASSPPRPISATASTARPPASGSATASSPTATPRNERHRRRVADPRPGRHRAPAGLGADLREAGPAEREGGPGAEPFTPERDVPGPYSGRGNDHPNGASATPIC
jgi:hypothetical protein